MTNSFLNALQLIALIPITGGTVVLGALVAPLSFKVFTKKEAVKLMMSMFKQFDNWLRVAASLLLGAKLVEVVFVRKFSFTTVVEVAKDGGKLEAIKQFDLNSALMFLVVLGIAGLSYYMAFSLYPKVYKAYDKNADKQKKEFNELHKQSELMHRINFVLGFLLLLSFAS